jgi:excisionase family DNA binding protein
MPQNIEVLTPDETAQRTKVAKQTLARWRSEGKGPAFVKLGRKVAYRAEDVAAWLAGRRFHSTAEAERIV